MFCKHNLPKHWPEVTCNNCAYERIEKNRADARQLRKERDAALARIAELEANIGKACWHCGVTLETHPAVCVECPSECDVDGCEAMGCSKKGGG